MQAIGRQPQRAPDGAPVHYECHRPEQTTLFLVQLGNVLGIDQVAAAQAKLERNAERYPVDKARGRSTKHDQF